MARFWVVATTSWSLRWSFPGWWPRRRRARNASPVPVYLVALGNALYVTINLFGHDPIYATLILGLYVLAGAGGGLAAASAAGWWAGRWLLWRAAAVALSCQRAD